MVGNMNGRMMINQRGIVQCLWAKDMTAKDIPKEMLPMCGEHCLSRQAVHILV
jgi:hypothetical protein